jgi:hypothetical protein
MVLYLRRLVATDHDVNPPRIEGQNHGAEVLQVSFVIAADVRLFVLGKPIDKHRTVLDTVRHDGAISAALSFAPPRHPLLDQPVPEVGINQATLGVAHCGTERFIADPLFALKARKILRLENPHACPPHGVI